MSNINENAISVLEGNASMARSVGADMAVMREAQEVQVAMVVAQRFPRNEIAAREHIMESCKRPSLAEKAIYEYVKGGVTVSGPSIHLAKEIARCWGNVDSGFKVIEATSKESTVVTYCWDLETNRRESRTFTVPNVRHTKNGSYVLTDPREIYENIANQAARRERQCILDVIPQDVVDDAVKACNKTLTTGSDKPIIDRVRKMVKMYADEFDITQEMLEAYIGRNADAFTVNSITRLGNVYNALKDGTQSVEEFKASIEDKLAKKPKKAADAKREAEALLDEPEEQVNLDEV